MSANRVIGRNGQLPWHLPEDLKFFKRLTLDHPIVMGRKTFQSIGRPLPRRRNIVISRTMLPAADLEVISSPHEIDSLGLQGNVYIIGGAQIFHELLPRCDSVYLTKVIQPHDGDAFMPPFESDFPKVTILAEWPEFTIERLQR